MLSSATSDEASLQWFNVFFSVTVLAFSTISVVRYLLRVNLKALVLVTCNLTVTYVGELVVFLKIAIPYAAVDFTIFFEEILSVLKGTSSHLGESFSVSLAMCFM